MHSAEREMFVLDLLFKVTEINFPASLKLRYISCYMVFYLDLPLKVTEVKLFFFARQQQIKLGSPNLIFSLIIVIIYSLHHVVKLVTFTYFSRSKRSNSKGRYTDNVAMCHIWLSHVFVW